MKNLSPDRFLLLKQNPSDKGIISSEVTYTFNELRDKVLTTASSLKDKGVSSQDNIGILGPNNLDFVINILALWQLSAVPVPLNTRLTESEISEQLTLANCQTILVQKEFSTKIANDQRKLIEYPFELSIDNSFNGKTEIRPKDPAVIIFTSGSTNRSKGVILNFGNLYNSAINSNHLLRYSHSDRWLATLPFYHVGGFSILARSLLFGIPLIIPDSLSFRDISKSLVRWQPTFISLVAAQLKRFVEEGVVPNPELKNCLLGGGFSDNELIKNAYELGWPANKVYGSTETSSFVTALLADEIIFKPNSVGRAVPTNKFFIYDSNGNELKPFEIGEIVIQSNALMSGYLNEAETKNTLKDGFYYSGDLGYMDEDGYLFIEGRKNFLISTGGENINPLEVEKVLLQHPFVKEAAVFPIEDKEWGEIIGAAVVLKSNSEKISYDELKIFLQERIAGFKIPKKIFFEDKLPKTDLGKIEKDKLINRYKL
jgi:O-succinylbenzoic acid--CoA ligase